MSDLVACRHTIERIDAQIMDLFMERMAVSAKVAAYKSAHGMPVLDRTRERANIERVTSMVDPELACHAAVIEAVLMDASREAQHSMMDDDGHARRGDGSPHALIDAVTEVCAQFCAGDDLSEGGR